MKPLYLLFFWSLVAPLFSAQTAQEHLFERYELIDKKEVEIQRELSWYLDDIKPQISDDSNDYYEEKWQQQYLAKVEAIQKLQDKFQVFLSAFNALFQLEGERVYGGLSGTQATLDAQNWYISYIEDCLFDTCWKPRYTKACKKDSPLHAIFTNNWQALKDQPHDPDLLLLDAVKYGTDNENCISLLLREGAYPNIKDRQGNTPLHYAAQKGKINVAQDLIRFGSGLNPKNHEGQTPLFMSYYDLDMIKLLLQNGASTEISDQGGRSVLDYAAEQFASKEVLEFLFDHKIPYNSCRIFIPVARLNSLKIVSAILSEGFDINFQDSYGDTALLKATHWSYTNEKLIKFLIQKGANPSLVNDFGDSPLLNAIEYQNFELLTLLTSQQIDINGKHSRKTPLFTAITKRWKEGVFHLLDQDADVNAINQEDKKTPLHEAAQLGCLKLAQTLVEKGADVHALDQHGESVFYEAAKENHLHFLRYLMDVSDQQKSKAFPYFFDRPPYVDPHAVMKLNQYCHSENPRTEVEVWDSSKPLTTLYRSTFLQLGYEGSFDISFDYHYIGQTKSGVHIIRTDESGGGTGSFVSLLYVILESKVSDGKTKATLRRIGDYYLGDRWSGSLKLDGNFLEIKTNFVGGTQEEVDSFERVELKFNAL